MGRFVVALALMAASSGAAFRAPSAQAQQQSVVPFILLAPDGTPIKNASVSLFYAEQGANLRSSGTGDYPTDEKGEVDFPQASAGQTLALTFWVPGVGSARVENVRASNLGQVPTKVQLVAGSSLKVRCLEPVSSQQKPVGNALVLVRRLNVEQETVSPNDLTSGQLFYGTTRDGEGVASFKGIPSGTYLVSTGNNMGFGSVALSVQLDQQPIEVTLPMERVMNSTVALTVLDAKGKPIKNQRFFLRTSYAPLSGDLDLSRPRITVAQATQWQADFRVWPNGYPLRLREVQTDAEGKAVIYPIDAGRWKLALVPQNIRTDNELLSSQVTVSVLSKEVVPATLNLKPDVKF